MDLPALLPKPRAVARHETFGARGGVKRELKLHSPARRNSSCRDRRLCTKQLGNAASKQTAQSVSSHAQVSFLSWDSIIFRNASCSRERCTSGCGRAGVKVRAQTSTESNDANSNNTSPSRPKDVWMGDPNAEGAAQEITDGSEPSNGCLNLPTASDSPVHASLNADTSAASRELPSPSSGPTSLGGESQGLSGGLWGSRGGRATAAGTNVNPSRGRPTQDPLELFTLCRQFRYEGPTRAGTLVVHPMSARQTDEVVDLLTDSFDDYFGIFSYRPYLRSQVSVYIAQRVMIFPRGVTLVGRLLLDDPLPAGTGEAFSESPSYSNPSSPTSSSTSTSGSSSLSPPTGVPPSPSSDSPAQGAGAPSYSPIVGVAEVSFGHPATPQFLTLNPPKGTAYLGNMAVRHPYRRQCVGRVLLAAAEALVSLTNFQDMHLHCRLVDDAPYGLYQSAGYDTVSVDHRLAPFLTWERRRRLMRKRIASI